MKLTCVKQQDGSIALVDPRMNQILAIVFDQDIADFFRSHFNLFYDRTKRLSRVNIDQSYVDFEDIGVCIPSDGSTDGQNFNSSRDMPETGGQERVVRNQEEGDILNTRGPSEDGISI